MSLPEFFHSRLRQNTRSAHEAVDKSFGVFDLKSVSGYRAFLSAHARVLFAAEDMLHPGALLPWWQARGPGLRQDMAALDMTPPPSLTWEAPRDDAARWGMIYVLEGSRLGGIMLARGVPSSMPHAYLSAEHPPGAWRALQQRLDAADAADPHFAAAAVTGARALFAAYDRAAALELAHV